MGWLDNFSLSNLFTEKTIPSWLQAGQMLIGGLTAPDPYRPYGETQAAFEANNALKQQQLAQELEIAKMQASAAGAGSGAAVAAARIAQQTALKQLKEKALADSLSAQLDYMKTASQSGQGAAQLASEAQQNLGQQARLGYQNAAQILQGFRA